MTVPKSYLMPVHALAVAEYSAVVFGVLCMAGWYNKNWTMFGIAILVRIVSFLYVRYYSGPPTRYTSANFVD